MAEEINFSLKEIYDVIRKRMRLIILITLTATIFSGVFSFFIIKPTYKASTSVIIGRFPSNEDSKLQYNDVMMYQNLVKTYVEIIKSRTVSEAALGMLKSNMKPEDLMKSITATPVANTQMIKIDVSAKSAEDAKEVTNAVTEAFINEAMEQFPSGTVKVVDPAVTPDNPFKPNKKLNVAIAFFLGLMVSLGIVFIIEYMDNTIKTENDVEKYIGLPVIGMIPKYMEEARRR